MWSPSIPQILNSTGYTKVGATAFQKCSVIFAKSEASDSSWPLISEAAMIAVPFCCSNVYLWISSKNLMLLLLKNLILETCWLMEYNRGAYIHCYCLVETAKPFIFWNSMYSSMCEFLFVFWLIKSSFYVLYKNQKMVHRNLLTPEFRSECLIFLRTVILQTYVHNRFLLSGKLKNLENSWQRSRNEYLNLISNVN